MKFNKKVILTKVKKFPFISFITFFLSTFFFISIIPLNVFGANEDKSALDVYTLNYSDGKWDGWLHSVVKAMGEYIVGPRDLSPEDQETTGILGLPYVNKGGALYDIARLSDSFYNNQPASFIVWAQDQYYQVREGVSFTAAAADPQDSDAYAPGIGYNILQPVLGMWQWSRNFVYGFYIIVLIAIAFLILLRKPMGGQEVVTIANSIPSVIISLILVTFSYAICGLFIDSIYLGSNIAYHSLIGAENAPGHNLTKTGTIVTNKYSPLGQVTNDFTDLKNVLQPDDPQFSIWNIFSLTKANVCNTFGNEKKCSFSYLIPVAAQNNIIGSMIATLTNIGGDGGVVGNALIELVLGIGIFQTSFKLFMLLLKEYLLLSFYPVIAPFIFLGAALPSNTNKTLNNVFKTLGGAAITFVSLYTIFLLLILFGYSAVDSTTQLGAGFSQLGQIKWAPPLLGYTESQIFSVTSISNNGNNMVTSLLIFGLYMSTPSIIDSIKKMLEVASPFQPLMQQASKDLKGVGKKALGTVGSAVTTSTGGFNMFS